MARTAGIVLYDESNLPTKDDYAPVDLEYLHDIIAYNMQHRVARRKYSDEVLLDILTMQSPALSSLSSPHPRLSTASFRIVRPIYNHAAETSVDDFLEIISTTFSLHSPLSSSVINFKPTSIQSMQSSPRKPTSSLSHQRSSASTVNSSDVLFESPRLQDERPKKTKRRKLPKLFQNVFFVIEPCV
ncbi:hypothetical protein AC1031_017691 [Aphanomyces cochlioides]|nr:hypothetical protein AC1031_017691 [Aphanomyces cochlioides]